MLPITRRYFLRRLDRETEGMAVHKTGRRLSQKNAPGVSQKETS